MLSRKASFNSHGEDSSYFLGWKEYEKNSYHEIHNPSGIIQMGLAENQVFVWLCILVFIYEIIPCMQIYVMHSFIPNLWLKCIIFQVIFVLELMYTIYMLLLCNVPHMRCYKCLWLMHVNLIMQLSFDLLESWLAKNTSVTHFKEDRGGSLSSLSSSLFRELALFQDYHGLPAFKKVRTFISVARKIYMPRAVVIPNICVNFICRDMLTILIISVKFSAN